MFQLKNLRTFQDLFAQFYSTNQKSQLPLGFPIILHLFSIALKAKLSDNLANDVQPDFNCNDYEHGDGPDDYSGGYSGDYPSNHPCSNDYSGSENYPNDYSGDSSGSGDYPNDYLGNQHEKVYTKTEYFGNCLPFFLQLL